MFENTQLENTQACIYGYVDVAIEIPSGYIMVVLHWFSLFLPQDGTNLSSMHCILISYHL